MLRAHVALRERAVAFNLALYETVAELALMHVVLAINLLRQKRHAVFAGMLAWKGFD